MLETHIRVPASAAGWVISSGSKTVNGLQNLTAAEVGSAKSPDENNQVIMNEDHRPFLCQPDSSL